MSSPNTPKKKFITGPLAVLEQILTTPEQIFEENEIKIYQGKFVATNNKNYLLRVIINDSIQPAKIVTVYRTSKAKFKNIGDYIYGKRFKTKSVN